MPQPGDFSYSSTRDGQVQIARSGKPVKMLGERASARFLNRIDGMSEQQAQLEMARVTGQYKFGNERLGKNSQRR